MSVRQSCPRQLVEGVQHTGYIVRVLISGRGEKDAPARRLPAYLRSSPMQTGHTGQGEVGFSKELMEHCTQSSGEVVLQISLLNSSLRLLEELCPSIGSCAHGLPLQPHIFFCASLCLFTSCKTLRVNVKAVEDIRYGGLEFASREEVTLAAG